MSSVDPRVLELRAAFDGAFAEPPPQAGQAGEALLALRVGGDPYAVRMTELSGLARDRSIAVVPGASEAFCGLSGWRGLLLPVWDLAALLGYPAARSAAPWLILAGGEAAWALAFERFEGYLRISPEALRPYAGQGAAAAHAQQAVLEDEGLRPVLELARLKEMIRSKNPSMTQRSA